MSQVNEIRGCNFFQILYNYKGVLMVVLSNHPEKEHFTMTCELPAPVLSAAAMTSMGPCTSGWAPVRPGPGAAAGTWTETPLCAAGYDTATSALTGKSKNTRPVPRQRARVSCYFA